MNGYLEVLSLLMKKINQLENAIEPIDIFESCELRLLIQLRREVEELFDKDLCAVLDGIDNDK